jgi:hypothetical protein
MLLLGDDTGSFRRVTLGNVFGLGDAAGLGLVPARDARVGGGMVGRVYLERGRRVVVLASWGGAGPRNVLVQRDDGTKVVRPFRGLRRTQAA